MAATNFTPIQLYRSSTAATLPVAGNLVAGELAINTTDEKLYFENTGGTVTLLASSAAAGGTFTTVTATTVVNGLGAVGTPSYTFTGDLNTGMWSPAADTIAFSEGGAEAMRISSSGFVGIGTTGPTTLLDVRGAAVGANVSAISIDNTSAGSGSPANTVSLNFSNAGSVKASITGAVYGDGYMAFATNTNTEKMRLTAAGSLGIGNTAPNTTLDVSGSITSRSGSVIADTLTNYGANLVINAAGSLDTIFQTNGTERMRLVTGGSVGIGTNAPGALLDVNGVGRFGGGTPSIISVGLNGDSISSNGDFYVQTSTANPLILRTNSAEVMRLTSAGLVGIGTSAPGTKLEVSSTSAGATVELLRLSNPGSGANTQAQIKFLAAGTNYGTITGGYGAAAPQTTFDLPSAGNYVWQQASVEKMRLDSAGKLSVGLTTGSNLGTQTKFAASGDAASAASLGSTSGSGTGALDTGISINQGGFGGTLLLLASRNTSTGVNTQSAVYIVRFYFDGNNAPTTTYIGGSGDFVTFGVSGSQTVTLTNSVGGNSSYAWFGNR